MTVRELGWIFKRAIAGWWNDNVPRLGASLAYYTLFALAPILIVAITIAGLVFGADAVQRQVTSEIAGLVGDEGGRAVQAMLQGASQRGGNGVATEKIKHANLVSFTCLKSFAFDQRFERKDAHDLIYCIEHAPEGMDAVAEHFRKERAGKHGAVIEASLAILRSRFTNDEKTEGYRKDGPVSVAKFELGEGDDPEQREVRALRQRQASDVIEQLLGERCLLAGIGDVVGERGPRHEERALHRENLWVERRDGS